MVTGAFWAFFRTLYLNPVVFPPSAVKALVIDLPSNRPDSAGILAGPHEQHLQQHRSYSWRCCTVVVFTVQLPLPAKSSTVLPRLAGRLGLLFHPLCARCFPLLPPSRTRCLLSQCFVFGRDGNQHIRLHPPDARVLPLSLVRLGLGCDRDRTGLRRLAESSAVQPPPDRTASG